jgi:hypothetical protein
MVYPRFQPNEIVINSGAHFLVVIFIQKTLTLIKAQKHCSLHENVLYV